MIPTPQKMSAYGQIPTRPQVTTPRPRLTLPLRPDNNASPFSHLSVHHITLQTAPFELVSLLWKEFSDEVERGTTYPQEGPLTRKAFEDYFLAADAFVGIGCGPDTPDTDIGLEDARYSRTWDDCVLGFYYIKPNYPGRSSHICNAGFVVRSLSRGRGVGMLLGQSYLHFAPLLGYKASVFNLVYANNTASLAIWDKLGFTRVGRIPEAGRLKRPANEGGGEHYVDAIVVWKSFE